MTAYVLISSVLVRNPESRISLSCIADHALPLRQPTRIHGVVERAWCFRKTPLQTFLERAPRSCG
jgi:hypothetical protein